MSTVLLDTRVVHWWSAEPDRVSSTAATVLDEADDLAVSAISWFELAWLAEHERILVSIPIRAWLTRLAGHVRTIGITPAIADNGCISAVDVPRRPRRSADLCHSHRAGLGTGDQRSETAGTPPSSTCGRLVAGTLGMR